MFIGAGFWYFFRMEERHSPLSKWERWADFTVRHPKAILVFILLVTAVMAFGMTKVKRGTNLLDYYREGPRSILEEIESKFKEGNIVELIFESASDRSLFEPEELKEQFKILQILQNKYQVKTHSIVDALDEGLRRVKQLRLSEIKDYDPVAEGMIGLAGGRTVRDLEKVSRHLLSHPEAVGFYTRVRIAHGLAPLLGEGAGVERTHYEVPYVKAIKAYVELPTGLSFEKQKKLLEDIRDETLRQTPSSMHSYLISKELISAEVDEKNQGSLVYMSLLVFAVDAFLFWAIFRKKREVFLILFLMITSLIWTFGLAGFAGVQMSFVHMLVIPILVGTCDDDAIVFGRQFYEERRSGLPTPQALRMTFRKTGTAIFLTTFSTFIGFLSGALPNSSRAIISFSLLVSFSMVAVFLLLILIQGPLRNFFKDPEEYYKPVLVSNAWYERWIHSFTRGWDEMGVKTVERFPRGVIWVAAFCFVGGMALSTGLHTEFARRIFLRPDMQTYQAEKAHEKYFGASKFGYLLLDGAIENSAVLEKIKTFQKALASNSNTEMVLGESHVDSVLDLFEKKNIRIPPPRPVREIFNEFANDITTGNYPLNQSFQELSEHEIYQEGGVFTGLLIKYFVNTNQGEKIRNYIDYLKSLVAQLKMDQMPGVQLKWGGGETSYYLEEGYLFNNFLYSFLMSFVVNFLVLWGMWRSFKDAVLGVLPLLVSLAITLGTMKLFGVTLNILNLMLGSILVGVGIDYPIHIIERFREEMKQNGSDRGQAVQETLRSMGPSVWGGALTTMGGFAACTLLAMPVAVSFGLLMALSIFLAYLASVFLLPILLDPPWKREKIQKLCRAFDL